MVEQVFLHPTIGLDGRHLPTAVTSRDDFDQGRALSGHGSFESFSHGTLGFVDRGPEGHVAVG